MKTANGFSVTESGSSGSPLLNTNRRVIGQLFGSGNCLNMDCIDPSADIANYGKFSVSWYGNYATQKERRLDVWLHPFTAPAPYTLDGIGVALPVITGSKLICAGTNYNFNATNWNGYTWSCSSNVIINSTSGNFVNVYGTNTSGPGWLSVVSGLIEVVRYNLWVGTPVLSYITGPSSVSVNGYYNYEVIYDSSQPMPSTFKWTFSESGAGAYSFNASSSVGFSFYNTGAYQILCQATNSCGTGNTTAIGVWAYAKSSSNSIATVYPNPVVDILYIEIDPPADSKTQITFDVRLLDVQGNLLRQTFSKGGTVEFNVSNLPDGSYYLHIYNGVDSKPEVHQIAVER